MEEMHTDGSFLLYLRYALSGLAVSPTADLGSAIKGQCSGRSSCTLTVQSVPRNINPLLIVVDAYVPAAGVAAGDADRATAHTAIQHHIAFISVRENQLFTEPDWFLSWVQAGFLLIGRAFQDIARIAIRAVIRRQPEIVIYAAVFAVALVLGGAHLALMAVRHLRVVCRQLVIENQDVLMCLHRHFLCVQMSGRLILLPDPLVAKLVNVTAPKHLSKWCLSKQSLTAAGFDNSVCLLPKLRQAQWSFP